MIGKLHFRRGLVAVATLLFAGCSALQVSVDVYKGPLVSEDSMLRQQAIAMALGAKPLMARLRASLVAHDRETRGLGTHQGELRRLEKTYGSTAVGFEGTIDWPPEARYLDGALSMYADLDSASC
ncbi:MAG: hypothetical protein R3E83_07805 [Burkholderiaceae bacterium]